MNGQTATETKKKSADDFSIRLSTIRIWMHEKDIGKLTRVLWAGQGNRLRQQASTNPRVKRFLASVPYVMNTIKDVHQSVVDNNLEGLQATMEPPVPPALVTCKDTNGLNVIHKAAGLGHTMILEYLLSVWPDGAHETDMTGKTPLHWAASAKNNMRCYTLLTQAGCDEDALDYKMKTPAYYKQKHNEIERSFLTLVPDAPRVSQDIPTDWEALASDDSDDRKKPEINIPNGRRKSDVMGNGLNLLTSRSEANSIENTSEPDLFEGDNATEEPPEPVPEEPEVDNADEPPLENGHLTNGNGEISEPPTPPKTPDEKPEEDEVEIADKPPSPPEQEDENVSNALNDQNDDEENGINEDEDKMNDDDIENDDHKDVEENDCQEEDDVEIGSAEEENNNGNENEEGNGENVENDEEKADDNEDQEEEIEKEQNNEETPDVTDEVKNVDEFKDGNDDDDDEKGESAKETDETGSLKENDEEDAEGKEEEEQNEVENENKSEKDEEEIYEQNGEVHEDDVIADAVHDPEEVTPSETENEPKDSPPEESEPEPESQPEESQPEESQPEESQPEESQPDESQPKESQPEESQPEESQPEESQPEEVQSEDHLSEDSQPPADEKQSNEKNSNENNNSNEGKSEEQQKENDDDDDDQDVELQTVVAPPKDENENIQEFDDKMTTDSPTSSLAIEGFVLGDSEDNQVQSESAAYLDDEEKYIKAIIESGDMEQLAALVLNGDGKKILNRVSPQPEIQAFLNNVPAYMNKISRVHEAARQGTLYQLQSALDRRKFAIAKDESSPNGASPLHVAVLFGHSDIVRYLAGRFPETTSAVDDDGRTALHYAATIKDNGHFFNLLSHLGGNPKATDKLGNTAEFYTNEEQAKDVLTYKQLLRRFGAETLEEEMLSDQGQAENYSQNAIFKTEQGRYLASSLGDPLIKGLTEIAEKRPPDPVAYLAGFLQNFIRSRKNNRDQDTSDTNSTALVNSEPEIIASPKKMNGVDSGLMEERFSSPETTPKNEDRDEHGQSMLHFACARAHRRNGLLNLIEESLIDVTYRDELYRTARDVSLQANQPGNAKEIDRYVLSLAVVGDTKPFEHMAISGYDHIIDVVDDEGSSIIEVAESRGHDQLVEFFHDLRNLEETREEMHQAIRNGDFDKVKDITSTPRGKWLIKAKNYYGRTAMHIAVLKEMEEMVEFFVNTCPDALKCGDNLERTPLHYAMGTNTVEGISRVLIRKGAKRTTKDLKGRQPSYYFMNKADILRLQEEEDEHR